MPDRVFRPSMKFVIVCYLLVLIVSLAAIYADRQFLADQPKWLMAIPLVLWLVPLRMHAKRRLVKLTLRPDRLGYESGLLSKTTRTMDLSKVQDVRVQQSLTERIFGVGTLTVQTAGSGEGGSIVMEALDQPHEVADLILDLSKKSEADRKSGTTSA
jgi:membrane protein YdbS with pleckstrin-like domain